MPFVETRFISPTTLTTSASSALYTVPTGYSAIIKQLVVTNITGTAATFTFYIGAASAGNALFSGTSVAANDTVIINLSQVLTTGEVLRALASVGSALNLTVSGVINDGPLASTATYIADNAITSAKIADGSVTTAKIAAGAVDTVDIAANAVTQAKLSTDIPLSGMRNVIINGSMQVAQRGTSTASITATGYYTADRWSSLFTTLGTWTQSVEADAPTGSGFRNSLKMLCTTADASPAAADEVRIEQLLEGQNLQQFAKGTASAQPFALSFWVKSNVTGTYIFNFIDVDNARSVSASYTISTSATWEKKTIILPADTTGAFDNDNALSLRCIWHLGAGSDRTSGTLNTVWGSTVQANRAVGQTNLAAATSNYWQITGVQLEVGSQPTPFEQRPIGVELALCQRYYWRITCDASGKTRLNSSATTYSGTSAVAIIMNPVPMRVKASSIDTSQIASTDQVNWDSSSFTSATINSTVSNVHQTCISFAGATGISSNVTGITISLSASTSSYFGASAEL